jgi:hypothetical protein
MGGQMSDQKTDRDQCAAEIEAALKKYKCAVVGVPFYRPDSRGGWFMDTRVDVVELPKP